jgi:hypothetical protein
MLAARSGPNAGPGPSESCGPGAVRPCARWWRAGRDGLKISYSPTPNQASRSPFDPFEQEISDTLAVGMYQDGIIAAPRLTNLWLLAHVMRT